jgi:hypothetical protein
MKTQTIVIIIIIIIAIYYGYKMKKEKIDDDLECKWTDDNGIIHNGDKSDCYKCNKCENINTKELTLRPTCIAGGPNKEKDLGFFKYHKLSSCSSY